MSDRCAGLSTSILTCANRLEGSPDVVRVSLVNERLSYRIYYRLRRDVVCGGSAIGLAMPKRPLVRPLVNAPARDQQVVGGVLVTQDGLQGGESRGDA